jgi:hypothetical protein
MLAFAAMFVPSIAPMAPGIDTLVPPAVAMAAGGALVRTGAAAVSPLPVSPLAVV